MGKIELSFSEIIDLKKEIFGGEIDIREGLLNQNISFITKYWLYDLGELVKEESGKITKIIKELIRKYGCEDDNGNIIILPYIEGEENPQYMKYMQEYENLMRERKIIEVNEFNLADFSNIFTKEHYPIFRKLIKNDK